MNRTLIIAEAGVNHNGCIDTAFRLIDAAKEAGADYVKFQTFKAEKLVSKTAQKAEYQSQNYRGDDNSQFSMLKRLELTDENHYQLQDYCLNKGIKFLSTGFDLESLDFLSSLGLSLCKIPSGEITNLPYLSKAASLFNDIILSTGMSTMEEISAAFQVIISNGISKDRITILHCNTEYPTPMADVNLRAMIQIREEFKLAVGYSDHTLGIEVPIAAVALGATVIEKHFTLDKDAFGPDHKASLDPQELKEMIKCIRNIELALSGSGQKFPSDSEKKNLSVARKSIHTSSALKKGHKIEATDLIMLRPGDGISPFELDSILGKRVNSDLAKFHKLSWSDF